MFLYFATRRARDVLSNEAVSYLMKLPSTWSAIMLKSNFCIYLICFLRDPYTLPSIWSVTIFFQFSISFRWAVAKHFLLWWSSLLVISYSGVLFWSGKNFPYILTKSQIQYSAISWVLLSVICVHGKCTAWGWGQECMLPCLTKQMYTRNIHLGKLQVATATGTMSWTPGCCSHGRRYNNAFEWLRNVATTCTSPGRKSKVLIQHWPALTNVWQSTTSLWK